MSSNTGTLEFVAIELSRLLRPLRDELKGPAAQRLLAEIGIVINLQQQAAISQPISDTINKTILLSDKSNELLNAIREDKLAEIVEISASMISLIKEVIDSLTGIKNAIGGLNLPGVSQNVISKVPERLFNLLLSIYIEQLSVLNPLLSFMGIIEKTDQNIGSDDPNNPPFTLTNFHFDKIANWLSDPKGELKNLYKWGDPSFDGRQMFTKLKDIFSRMNMGVLYDDMAPTPKLDILLLEATPKTDVSPRGLELLIKQPITSADGSLAGTDFDLRYKAGFATPVNTKIFIQPGQKGISILPPTGSPDLSGEILLEQIVKKKSSAEPYILLGQAGGSRFELMEFHLKTGTKLIPDGAPHKAFGKFFIEGAIKGAKVVISASGADGFLKSILPSSKLEANFDLNIGVSEEHGLYFGGSSALEVNLPVHVEAGPVSLEGITLGLQPQNGKFPVKLGADIRATLGPMVAVVRNMGVSATFSFAQNNAGNLGPLQLNMGFKPPSGVGLSIDAGIVKGGGFLLLNPDKGEYAGGLELTISNTIQVGAIGIINTKMPDGSQGFSLLIVVSVQFNPGIALGMGFFLNGLGGMLGIHRTIKINALRDGIKNNTIEQIMFPKNIVANMNSLLPQIKSIFPVKKNQFIIGLMAKITWGVPTLVSIEFGLAVEFSNPARIAILGVLKVVLPAEKAPLLQLQVNFLGVIDFDNGYLSFDASLYNSRILSFTLQGDMALRLNWGAKKAFLMSIGGFHPSFNPPAQLNVPKLKRLSLTILSGNPRLVLTAYFAVTSNTVQFGARIDFRFNVAFVSVVGFLGFDVLFQFSPFKFIAHIFAGLAVKWDSTVLFAIQLDFQLSGPTPWNARGLASFTVLFWTIKVGFNITWGKAKEIIEPSVAVLPKILEALALEANWSAELPVNKSSLVTLASLKPKAGEVIIQSHAAIKINQTILPLDTTINKFGNGKPADIQSASIKAVKIGGQANNFKYLRDSFVPAAFKKMSDDDKLKSPSYTLEKSGIKITDNDNTLNIVYGINRDVQYETRVTDIITTNGPDYILLMELFKKMMQGGVVGKSALAIENDNKKLVQPGAVEIGEEQFVIINNKTLLPHGTDLFKSGSKAEANDVYASFITVNPQLKNILSVVPAYHLDF